MARKKRKLGHRKGGKKDSNKDSDESELPAEGDSGLSRELFDANAENDGKKESKDKN